MCVGAVGLGWKEGAAVAHRLPRVSGRVHRLARRFVQAEAPSVLRRHLRLPSLVAASILILLAGAVVLLPDGWWPARSVLSVLSVSAAAIALLTGGMPASLRAAAPYVAYGAVMVASAWLARFPPASTDVLVTHGCAAAVVFAVARLTTTPDLRAWTMLAVLVSLQMVLLGTFGPQFYPDVYGRSRFYAAVIQWGAYPELGLLALLFGAACAAAAMALRGLAARSAACVLLAFAAVVPFYVESRGAQLALVGAVCWVSIAALIRWRDRVAAGVLALVAAGVIAATVYVFIRGVDVRDRVLRAATATEWRSRSSYWQAAWQMARERPVLGVGPGRYRLELPRFSNTTVVGHAHNMPLHVAAETGLPGLAAFVWLWVRVLRRSFATAGHDTGGVVAFMTHAMLVAFVLRGATDHFLTGVHSSFRTALLVGIIFGLAESRR
jgi:O-antigen ligase